MKAATSVGKTCLVLVVAAVVIVSMLSISALNLRQRPDEPSGQSTIIENFGQSEWPMIFETNQGQADPRVGFISRGGGYSLYLTPAEAVLALQKPASYPTEPGAVSTHATSPTDEPAVLRMRWVGADREPQLAGVEALPGKVNYILGNDPAKWRTNIPTYSKVKYEGVYPGIDLVYYGNQGQLEYDFIVAPGVDPASIRLGFESADKLEVDNHGDLILSVADGQVRMRKPFVYQELDGVRTPISGSYDIRANRQVGFRLGAYDTARPLMIDPQLIYSTYIGGWAGGGNEQGMGLVLDNAGNMYLSGITSSTNLPLIADPPPLQPLYGGGTYDAFVMKLNPAGSAYLYTTYLGGNGWDTASSVAVDAGGHAYISGSTDSTNFPTHNPFQAASGGGLDTYVAKLSPDGSALVYATYLGGAGDENSADIGLDSANNAFLSGQTQSTNFPTANPIQAVIGGSADAYLVKLNAAGSGLIYSTYLGGAGNDSGDGIAVDNSGSAFMVGTTLSGNFPTRNPLQAANASPGLHDAVVAKIDPGGALVFSTYLGGDNDDGGNDIAVDVAGNAYFTGGTLSSNFPTVGAARPDSPGQDAFVTKIDATGSAWVYSTYLGGNGGDVGWGIAVGRDGSAYVTGNTTSTDFPLVDPAQPTFGGGADLGDAFVTRLDPAGKPIAASTYLGGSDGDRGRRVVLDPSDVVHVTGETWSANFPLVNPLQTSRRGDSDAFIVKMCSPHITVTSTADSGVGSLRQAVADVCVRGIIDFDLSYPATITLTSYLPINKSLSIVGPGVANLAVSGGGITGIFYVNSPSTLVAISEMTIDNAYYQSEPGAGIHNKGTTIITNTTFSNNRTVTGGAIYNGFTGVMTITTSSFVNNQATGSAYAIGGAISNEGTLSVVDSTFSENTAVWGAGGIQNTGVLTITNSTFSDNNTQSSGAGIFNSGNLSVQYGVFSGNNAGGGGGGISNNGGTLSVSDTIFANNTANSGGGIMNGGSVTVRNSTFVGNAAVGPNGWGGGIYNLGNSVTTLVSNSTFTGNTATLWGGGISNFAGTLTILNSTLSGNSAPSGGGGAIHNDWNAVLNYANTILANSLSGGECWNNAGTIGANINNLVEDGSCLASLSGDPLLGTLADNGGSTQTMALMNSSSAIDAGDDATCAASPVNGLDQRGGARPQGAHCDIGAYEYGVRFHLIYLPLALRNGP